MRPEAGEILDRSADQLLGQLAPRLGESFAQGTAALLALVMKFSAREYERGAEIRARENAELRMLFARFSPALSDTDLARRLDALARTTEDSLAISALDAANKVLRRALIELHARVEEQGDLEAERAIWHVLRAMADRRAVALF